MDYNGLPKKITNWEILKRKEFINLLTGQETEREGATDKLAGNRTCMSILYSTKCIYNKPLGQTLEPLPLNCEGSCRIKLLWKI